MSPYISEEALPIFIELLKLFGACSSLRRFKLRLVCPSPHLTTVRNLDVPFRYRKVLIIFDFFSSGSIVVDGAGGFQVTDGTRYI